MDFSRTLDEAALSMATGATRRSVMRGMLAGGLVALSGRHLRADAQVEMVAVCKRMGKDGTRAVLLELPSTALGQVGNQEFFSPYYCGSEPVCEPCCVEWHESCTSDADCCSNNCLESGICGDLCYCYDRYNDEEQAELGPLCGASTGGMCNSTQPGCTSSADCEGNGEYTTCVEYEYECNASGGMCAYALSECES
jgi:hypothetical protein